jgi:hypothetical protein
VRPFIAWCCAALAALLFTTVSFAQVQPGSGGHAPGAGARPANFAAPATAPPAVQPTSPQAAAAYAAAGISAGETYYEGGAGSILGPEFGGDYETCGPGGCNHCGRFGQRIGPCGPCCFGGLYVRAEYLLWGTKGADLPALVTTSPADTEQNDAGVLGEPGTRILFGDESVNSNTRSGGRITFGWWFDPCRRLGVEGEYFALKDETDDFRGGTDDFAILARPFYDVVDGEENASLTSFPGLVRGDLVAEAETRFQGSGVRAIYNLCCGDGCGTSCITCCPVATGYRFDAIIGYRFLRVDDRVSVVENSTSLDSEIPGAFFIRDSFESENQFHGVDLGTGWSWCKGCFSLDLVSKLALGNTRSKINIAGSTVITEGNESQTLEGGILAQRTNSGSFQADEFAVVPELGLTIGYQLNPCWRATLGYTFIYWSRVARAGDQIDRELNPNLFPPEQEPQTTHLRPEFNIHYTDFWAQGLTAGLEGSW